MEDKNNKSRIRLAISQGDINGISYEVILKTFSDSRMFDICTPVLYGSTKVASYHKKLLALHQDMSFNAIREAHEAGDRKFNVINLTNDEIKIEVGKLTEVLTLPAQNIYIVQGEQEHSIPAVPEFILETDVANRRIRVHLIEGM